MSDRMIEILIKETTGAGSVQDVVTTEVIRATVPPKLAAAALRALADEWDPKKPIMRGVSE